MATQHLRQPLTSEEQQRYNAIFQQLDPEQLGIVTGEGARSTFEKSGLPPTVLGEIWQLADPTNLGFLNQFAFSIALRLIGHVQAGAKLDKSLVEVAGPLARFGNDSPQSPAVLQTAGTASLSQQFTSMPPLTNHDLSKFTQLFAKNAPSGVISGEQARMIFMKAKLPTTTLGQIWALVDRSNAGQLSKHEFIVAMYLIQNTLNGSLPQLPTAVPQSIWDQASNYQISNSTGGSMNSFASPKNARPAVNRVPSSFANASADWTISAQKKQQFNSLFESLDKESRGVLGAGEVAPFLMTSNLPQDVLATIWDLADIHNTGEFTKDEFAIAMFLVQKKIAGAELPNIIPESLLPQYHGDAVVQSTPAEQQPQSQTQQQSTQIPQIPSRDTKPKSSLTDLVDLNDAFSTPSPSIPADRNVSNSSVKYTPTGSKFVPTSSFGQGLAERDVKSPAVTESPSSTAIVSTPPVVVNQPSVSSPTQSSAPNFSAPPSRQASFQPQATGSGINIPSISSIPIPVPIPIPSFSIGGGNSSQSKATAATPARNNDLLADANPEVSGKLSKATTDLANLSTQIGSLTSQTSQLHDKRARAEAELAKITALKTDIETKLTNLRFAYETEVQKTAEAEELLGQVKVEVEELRKEASIAEAQHHQAQTNLASIQAELEATQLESSSLKEKLATWNTEHAELQAQLEKTQNDCKQSKGLLAINSKQLDVNNLKSEGIKAEIAALLAATAEIATHHEALTSKQAEISTITQTIADSEAALEARRQKLEQSEAEFSTREQEFAARLEEQKQNQAIIEQQDARISELVAGLQERKAQLDEAEAQLNQQQIEYAQRIQEFSYKQIQDATTGFAPLPGSTTSKSTEVLKELEGERTGEPDVAGTSVSGTTAAVVGGLVGASVASVAAATASETTESEPANTQFSSPTSSTEQGTSIASDEFQYRTANQFNNLDIERNESPSSSVQNNAPQSVRDETEERSEEETTPVEETEAPALAEDVLAKDYNTEGSGAGSFELVGEDGKSESESTLRQEDKITGESADAIEASIPGAWSSQDPTETTKEVSDEHFTPILAAASTLDEPQVNATQDSVFTAEEAVFTGNEKETENVDEFPPIQELEINESDSDDEFHETNEVPEAPTATAEKIEEQDEFADLEKTTKETSPVDEFTDLQPAVEAPPDVFDEFAGLEAAPEETFSEYDEFAHQQDLQEEIEGNTFFGADRSTPQQFQGEDNEEWEQIFAGFGNQSQPPVKTIPQHALQQPQPVQADTAHVVRPRVATTPRSLAVQELEGMGFSKEEALSALEREKWNLEAATNYLLDNA